MQVEHEKLEKEEKLSRSVAERSDLDHNIKRLQTENTRLKNQVSEMIAQLARVEQEQLER